MAAGETVLYYHPDEEYKPPKLAGVLFRMKIRIRRVQPNEIGETIGYLAGLKGFEKREITDESSLQKVDDEVLVLSNLSNSRLNELLAQMRKAGIPKIALKAMVTPTNCNWPFCELYKEIKEEHETLTAAPQSPQE